MKKIFYIPEKCIKLVEELVLKHMPKDIEKFYYIIHTLNSRRFKVKKYTKAGKISKTAIKKRFIPLYSVILQNILTSHKAKKIISILLNNDIIECDNSYSTETHKSKGYRLHYSIINSSYVHIKCSDKFRKKIEHYEAQFNNKKLEDNHKLIFSNIKDNFTFDYEEAKIYLDSLNLPKAKYDYYNMQIGMVRDKDFYFGCSNNNVWRIYHNYINLKKTLRQFIQHKSGEQIVEVDIANAQPFFLGTILTEYLDASDIKHYFKLVSTGRFYQFMSEKFDYNIEYIKENMQRLLFYNGKYSVPLMDEFEKEFPTVWNAMQEIKKKKYNDMAIFLQRQEADLMVNNVLPELLKERIDFIPIHDSVIVQETQVDRTVEIIKEQCQKLFGKIPTIKIK